MKIQPKRYFICFIYVSNIFLSYLLAGISGKLTGLVVDDETGVPLIGVNVILLETTQKVVIDAIGELLEEKTITVQTATGYGASTDIDGEYIIDNVPLGKYTIKATYIGYEDKEISISINKDKK